MTMHIGKAALIHGPRLIAPLRRCGVFIASASILGIATATARGTILWLFGFAALITAICAVREAVRTFAALFRTERKVDWMTNVAVAVGVCVVGFEVYLGWLESSAVSAQASAISAAPTVNLSADIAARHTEDGEAPAKKLPLQFRNSEFALPPDLREEMKRRSELLSLPQEWQKKRIEIAGATSAYSWHG